MLNEHPDKSEQGRVRDQSRICPSTLIPEIHWKHGLFSPPNMLMILPPFISWGENLGSIDKIQWGGQNFWPVWLSSIFFFFFFSGSITNCHLNHVLVVCFASINSFNPCLICPRKLVTEMIPFCRWGSAERWDFAEKLAYISQFPN